MGWYDFFSGHYGTFGARVEVKRVFRGRSDLGGQIVLVGNFGNPKICVSRAKIGDTRIFFTDQVQQHHSEANSSAQSKSLNRVKLRSSLLRLTLPNLKILWNLEKEKGRNDFLIFQSEKNFDNGPLFSLTLYNNKHACSLTSHFLPY